MPSKEEKQRRKQLGQQLQAVGNQAFLAGLPMSPLLFQQLFNWLDEKLEDGCDDTLRLTQQFATAKDIPFEPLKIWLREQGGYCDCEVLANVEEHLERLK